MNRLLSIQAKFQKLPFGKALFSFFAAKQAPYFWSIRPMVQELRPHYCQVTMKKRRRVHNHLKTVHAIAICNLCEMAAGFCIEASIPKSHRWIPMGMTVSYLKKAKTNMQATCILPDIDWDGVTSVICPVSVLDTEGVEVVRADIEMKVSRKKEKDS